MRSGFIASFFALLLQLMSLPAFAAPTNPIVFVGQIPIADEFGKVTAPFSNHLASMIAAPRGGGLFIRYPDGTVANLTQDAGFNGPTGLQSGDTAIAVRDPAVHWSGNKIIFSMVVGAPTARYEERIYHWQVYEITGIGQGQSRTITKVPFQPEEYNNVMPIYGPDDSIYFVSDRPRDGASHLYPQLGEKESAPSNSGIWKLNPSNGSLEIVKYSTSGIFDPFIDSRGKIVYSEANFLQQDPQAVDDTFGAFNYSDESASAARLLQDKKEVFPEQQETAGGQNGLQFGYQLPWQTDLTGSTTDTLFGLGRHELLSYFEASLNSDPAVKTFLVQFSTRATHNSIFGLLDISESNSNPPKYLGTNAAPYVFNTHGAGQIVELIPNLAHGPQGLDLKYITSQETAVVSEDDPPAGHTGLYRDPISLTSGDIVAAHTNNSTSNADLSDYPAPDEKVLRTRYEFRLRQLTKNGEHFEAGALLTGSGISASLTYFDPNNRVEYTGPLWELQPVEVIARARPNGASGQVPQPEQILFDDENVDLAEFQEYLETNKLALLVVRDATSRDSADQQQPFNLRVEGTEHEISTGEGVVYGVSALQIFQADYLRGYERPKGSSDEVDLVNGRRALPVPIQPVAGTPNQSNLAEGSFTLLSDGSAAALVPADRPLTWQLVNASGDGVVRERFWFNLKAGEITACGSCHPANNGNQIGAPEPDHQARALRSILRWWKGEPLSVSPEYAMDVRGTRRRRRIKPKSFKRGKIFTKRQFQISIDPTAGDADFQDLELRVKINRKYCDQPVLTFQTEKDGSAFLMGKGPKMPRRRIRLDFELVHDGEIKQTSRARLIRRRFPRERNRKIKRPRRFNRMCRKLRRNVNLTQRQ